MKYLILLLLSGTTIWAHAQQKGVSPVEKSTSSNAGSTYALVIGISDYQDEGIPDLRFADKDALAFASFLRSEAGGKLDEEHIKVLLNQEATMAQFAIALDWLWEVAKEGDQVIIYFSGHGDVEKKSLTQPGFLLCWDAPARVYMAGGAFPLPMLQEVISTLSVQNKAQVIMVSDACRSGKLSGSAVGGAAITGSNLAKQYANEIKILSCQPDEFSIEGEQWGGGRGAFSFHLLEGLYGLADKNQDLKVNLLEISRYLEDHVTLEVEPQSQIPMVIGNKATQLVTVNPDILADLVKRKKGEMPQFAMTETRGREEDVLANLDSSIVKIYFAFKNALEQKQFLSPEDACADKYYAQLIQEPGLEPLYSSMQRNYAAALQDDAQQILNTLLKTGLTKEILFAKTAGELYEEYPNYLQRAAELLGENHYMYATLQARKYFFQGKIETDPLKKQEANRNALKWQENMPHAYSEMINTFSPTEADSAEYYARKAADLVPSWVVPYIQLHIFYDNQNDNEKAKDAIEQAYAVDSTSLFVKYRKGLFYSKLNDFENGEKWLTETAEGSGENICFPCAYNDLGMHYIKHYKFDLAEKALLQGIELDSNAAHIYLNLGNVYGQTRRFDLAEKALVKAIRIKPDYKALHLNLGHIYAQTGKKDLAEACYERVLELDPNNFGAFNGLGMLYSSKGEFEKAEIYFEKALSQDSTGVYALNALAIVYNQTGRSDQAADIYRKIIKLDSLYGPAYVNLGDYYLSRRKFERAKEFHTKALATPILFAHPYAHQSLTQYYLFKQDLPKAEYHANKVQELYPGFPGSLLLLGQVYLRKGLLEEAKSLFEQQSEVPGQESSGSIFMAMYAVRAGDIPLAWKYLEQGLQKGYPDKEGLEIESDLEPLISDEKWKELMDKYFPEK